MIKLKADEKLFNKINILGDKIKDLGAIVQNDMQISKGEWIDFVDRYEHLINSLDDWMSEVRARLIRKK